MKDMKPYLIKNDAYEEVIVLARDPISAKKFLRGVVDLPITNVLELKPLQKIRVNSNNGHGSANLTAAFWCELFAHSRGPVLLSYPQED